MASTWKDDRTPHVVACVSAPVGQSIRQFKKTTGTGDKKLARRIADEFEEAARGLRSAERIAAFLDEITDVRTRRVVRRGFDDLLRLSTGRGLGSKTARGFISEWRERTRSEVSPATWAKYAQVADQFLSHLGGLADQDMSAITKMDITRFRDAQAARVAPATANLFLKILRIIFGAAEADGVVPRNEARQVKRIKDRRDKSARRAFTLEELKRVLEKCGPEWRSLVLVGFYTGARLGDVAQMTWQNVDLVQGTIYYTSRKTDRRVAVPLAEPLRRHLESLPAGDDPRQPLHPRAFEIVRREGRTGTLSRKFGEILAEAGLVAARSHQADDKTRKGRATRRELSDVSFHALRHTAVSLLKSAGVSDAVARDVVGHESEAVSRLYTHIEDKAKREAVNTLPVIGTDPDTATQT
jgi:integrase